ncbi:MAG: type II CAAX prenyl endopeptidase Rce1 family protein [Anaerolineae bacterium]
MSGRDEVILFRGGIWPLAVFVLVMALLPIGLFGPVGRLFPERSPWVGVGATVLGASAIYALSWGILRWEGLRPANLGLSWAHALPGLLPVVGIWAGVNALAAVIGWMTSGTLSPGLLGETSGLLWIATAVEQWLFVGPAEELGARAYLQNKLVALVGGGHSRWRKAAGIVAAAALFALWHIPQRLWVQEMPPSQAVLSAMGVIPIALLFGLLYEVTRNAAFCGLLHGTLNHQPFFFAGLEGPGWLSLATTLSGLALIAAAIWLYRRWATAQRPADFWPVAMGRRGEALVVTEGLAR